MFGGMSCPTAGVLFESYSMRINYFEATESYLESG
jgi:hypothetical protein